MDYYWYVLRSKPRKEDALWQQVHSQGFDVFYPRIPVHPANPRARKVASYFPSYMFVRVNVEEVSLSTFQWMPHSYGLICFDNIPAQVPDELIAAIRQRVNEIAAAEGELFYGLKHGDPIVIRKGPFAGYDAIFDARLSGNDRVRVLIRLLSDRHVPLELHAGQISRR